MLVHLRGVEGERGHSRGTPRSRVTRMLAFDYYFLRLTLPQLKGVGEFRSARLNKGQLGGDHMEQASVINGVFHMGCFGPNH